MSKLIVETLDITNIFTPTVHRTFLDNEPTLTHALLARSPNGTLVPRKRRFVA